MSIDNSTLDHAKIHCEQKNSHPEVRQGCDVMPHSQGFKNWKKVKGWNCTVAYSLVLYFWCDKSENDVFESDNLALLSLSNLSHQKYNSWSCIFGVTSFKVTCLLYSKVRLSLSNSSFSNLPHQKYRTIVIWYSIALFFHGFRVLLFLL